MSNPLRRSESLFTMHKTGHVFGQNLLRLWFACT
ncbi:Uncharacterised protein [Vibrio cholerae]|nr:Uncharacterised protein [Vibrio cholerae]CSI72797.1 Uncharacterised protein [Vibrio cholerae]